MFKKALFNPFILIFSSTAEYTFQTNKINHKNDYRPCLQSPFVSTGLYLFGEQQTVVILTVGF
jgi:hypothetical protein